MLLYIVVMQSREENHKDLYYAYLQWDSNWTHPDFIQCAKGKERALELLYEKVKDNLGRIGKSWEYIQNLKVVYE